MTTDGSADWVEVNRGSLASEIARLHTILDALVAGETADISTVPTDPSNAEATSLGMLAALFGLDSVDRTILLLAAGTEN